jgi:hypothetical protein
VLHYDAHDPIQQVIAVTTNEGDESIITATLTACGGVQTIITDAVVVSYRPNQIKVGLLPVDFVRISQALEWEGMYVPQSSQPASGLPAPRKVLLYRCHMTRLTSVLSAAVESLPSGKLMLLYISADGATKPSEPAVPAPVSELPPACAAPPASELAPVIDASPGPASFAIRASSAASSTSPDPALDVMTEPSFQGLVQMAGAPDSSCAPKDTFGVASNDAAAHAIFQHGSKTELHPGTGNTFGTAVDQGGLLQAAADHAEVNAAGADIHCHDRSSASAEQRQPSLGAPAPNAGEIRAAVNGMGRLQQGAPDAEASPVPERLPELPQQRAELGGRPVLGQRDSPGVKDETCSLLDRQVVNSQAAHLAPQGLLLYPTRPHGRLHVDGTDGKMGSAHAHYMGRHRDMGRMSGRWNRMEVMTSLSVSSANKLPSVRRQSRDEAQELMTLDEEGPMFPTVKMTAGTESASEAVSSQAGERSRLTEVMTVDSSGRTPSGGSNYMAMNAVQQMPNNMPPDERNRSFEALQGVSSGGAAFQEGQIIRAALRHASVSSAAEEQSASTAEVAVPRLSGGWARSAVLGGTPGASSSGEAVLPVTSAQQLLLPSDLLGMTRKRLLLIVDSDRANVFEQLRQDFLSFRPFLLLSPQRLRRVHPPVTQVVLVLVHVLYISKVQCVVYDSSSPLSA